jgi:hypothetical protein
VLGDATRVGWPDHPMVQSVCDFSGVGERAGSVHNAPGMGVTVEIEQPELLSDLVNSLAAGGCLTSPIDERVCRVVHIGAIDAAEELQELRFFLRAWQAQRGTAVTMRPEPAAPDAPAAAYGAARSNGFSIKPCS